MKQFQLSKEEKLELSLIAEKRKNIAIQQQMLMNQDNQLVKDWNKIVEDFTMRNSQKIENAKGVNLDTGMIEYEEKEIAMTKTSKKEKLK